MNRLYYNEEIDKMLLFLSSGRVEHYFVCGYPLKTGKWKTSAWLASTPENILAICRYILVDEFEGI